MMTTPEPPVPERFAVVLGCWFATSPPPPPPVFISPEDALSPLPPPLPPPPLPPHP